ncbi:MAG: adenylate/guanylate cyclase domain-containing protein [Rhodospirillales bacterium]|nr:adenylate/guanylate cyclase domain-containing protein [Rhodospirillales bacterium]
MTTNPSVDIAFEQPYPLRRLFLRRIVPGLVVFAAILVTLSGFGANEAMRAIYLELAVGRADTIARAVAGVEPEAWEKFLTDHESLSNHDSAALAAAFAGEISELHISKLKVYSPDGHILFSTRAEDMGQVETGDLLATVLRTREGVINAKVEDGIEVYELYVPWKDDSGRMALVLELYEPVSYLNTILWRNAAAPVLIPGILLLVLMIGLGQMVRRAQNDIDLRTNALAELRRRLETFVSSSAATAARGAVKGVAVTSAKIRCTVLFSDVRDFTGFAGTSSADDVVEYLNHIMTLQVEAVNNHGGDVDKMIGDAVMARFEGKDAEARALAAAHDIIVRLSGSDLPRKVGVGVFTGEVISGAIGTAARQDFTVIGDAVNMAARLCGAAAAGEIVADIDTVGAARAEGFLDEESLTVKGREAPLRVRRSTP